MATLILTLKKQPFEVMITGEKDFEVRKPSKWMLSRLRKQYKFVEFRNGYRKGSRRFTAEFFSVLRSPKAFERHFSNGLTVKIEKDDIVILLGKVQKGNS